MVCVAEAIGHSNARRAPVLLMDWKIVGITPPEMPMPMPVPESPPPAPMEVPETKDPVGAPAPTESPIPVREPPSTLPPQS